MSYSVTLSLAPAGRATMQRLAGAAARVQKSILRAIDEENQLTIGQITALRLSRRSPETLGVVTNRLRSSIRASKSLISGDTIRATIGSNVAYAGVHEFGIDANVTVRAHSRTITQVFGKRIDPRASTVRSHTRHMLFPARAYIRKTVEERATHYATALTTAATEGLNNG